MGITLRNSKGSPLTHNELDANFQEFYYSASFTDYHVSLFKSKSLEDEFTVPVNVAKGPKYSIQLKVGNDATGSQAAATGSSNLTYNFDTDVLRITGSSILSGSGTVLDVKGNGEVSGNLVVGGTITAEEFITERTATSYIYKSGSTKFGDTSDDRHDFTGSLGLSGSATFTGDLAISGHTNVSSSISSQSQRLDSLESKTLVSSSAQLAADISGSLSNPAIASLGAGIISSSAQIAADISGSYELTNAKIQALGAGIISASSQIADLGVNIPSSSAQVVTLIDGQDVNLGRVTSTEMVTNIISSSVQLASGSNIFGDASDDKHEFTGSVHMSSTLSIAGFPNVSQSLASAVAGTGIQNVVEDTTPQLGGNLDINSNNISGSGTIDISGDISGSNMLIAGDIDATGDITAYYSSDNRLKDNITPIEGALDKINQIGGYEFDWNNNSSHSGHDVGVIAQEIEAVLPEVVATRDNGYKAVRYEKIVALLIQALKEQQSQIQDLQSRL